MPLYSTSTNVAISFNDIPSLQGRNCIMAAWPEVLIRHVVGFQIN